MKRIFSALAPRAEPFVRSYRYRILLSVFLGLIGFAISFLSPVFIIPPHTISITWYHIFPLLAAIGYGPRYGFLAGVVGLAAFSPILAWPTNGWANIVPVTFQLLFYAGHGYCAEARRIKAELWNNPFIAQIFFAIAYGAAIFFLYPVLFSLNPPFWSPTVVSHMPEPVIIGIILKNTATMFGCVLAAAFIYMTPGARRLLGVSSPKYAGINGRIFLASIISMAGVWFLWQMLNSIFMRTDFPKSILHVSASHEIITMLVLIVTCLMGGYSIALSMEKRNIAEEALRESEGKYRELVETANSIILRMDTNGMVTFFNEYASQFFGFSHDEIIGQNVVGTILPSTDSAGKDLAQMILDIGAHPERYKTNENENMCKDGTRVWVVWTNKPILDDQGRCVEVLCVGNDITDRKQAERRQVLMTGILGIINESPLLIDTINRILISLKREMDFDAVGIRLRNGDDFPYFVQNGFPDDFLLTENTLIVRDPDGSICKDENGNISLECTCGSVISGKTDSKNPFFTEGGSFWTNNSLPLLDLSAEQDPRLHPRNNCIHRGYMSVALIPIRLDQEIVGLLQLNARRKDCFTLDMIYFFEGLASSIGIALTRKQAEEALRRSEEKFFKAFRANPSLMAIRSLKDGRFVDVNDAYTQVTGFSREELIGADSRELGITDSETIESAREIFSKKGHISNAESKFKTKTGDIRTGLFSEVAIEIGNELCILSALQDITDRKRSIEALQNAANEWSSSFNAMSDGVSIHAADHTILNVNNTLCVMLGKREEELIGKKCYEIFHGTDNPIALCPIELTRRTLKDERAEFFEITLNKWLSVSSSPVLNDSGQLIRLVHVVRDITRRKKAEKENDILQAQLLQSQKMEAIGQLAGGMAHDFNNMLGVILGHAEIAIEQTDSAQAHYADLQEIRKAAERSSDLTRQLLGFARKQTVTPKVLDLNETIEGMLKMLRRLIGEDIHLNWLPDTALWPIKLDPSQIDQILVNLCVNARDAVVGVGKISIETGNISLDEAYCADHVGFVPGEYALIAVSDDGCGMDEETLRHVFEPFFTTKEKGKGTGLGLATVYGIIKQNNGFIYIYSEPAQGTTFKIYLPRYIGKAEQALTKEPQEPVMGGQETVLVVEDEPSLLDLSKLILETQGYLVLTAGTPGEAIRLAEKYTGEIHLLMTDVVMPEMNGRDLSQKMLSFYPNLKRLFMSGYTADIIVHNGVLDEGVHFIQKPFSRKNLLAKVRETLDHKHGKVDLKLECA